MSDKVLLPFEYKGVCNFYPVYISITSEWGIYNIPRSFPRLFQAYMFVWETLFKRDIIWTTATLEDRLFVEKYREELDVFMD